MAAGRLALLCLAAILLPVVLSQGSRSGSGSNTGGEDCDAVTFPAEVDHALSNSQGHIVLVALMKGYCGYCAHQAEGLQRLREELASLDYPDISMVVINGGGELSRYYLSNLVEASDITVVQDDRDNSLYNFFQGQKDDFIIYSRCRQRVAYIPHPYSHLGHSITSRILRAVHLGRQDCYCALDYQNSPDIYDTMQGDQPLDWSPRNHAASANRHHGRMDLECPVGDRWCRRYARRFRNNRLHPSRRFNRPRLSSLEDEMYDPIQDQVHDFDHHGHRGHHGHHFSNRRDVMRHFGVNNAL